MEKQSDPNVRRTLIHVGPTMGGALTVAQARTQLHPYITNQIPLSVNEHCSSNISALQLEKCKRMLVGLQLQNNPSSAETSHACL